MQKARESRKFETRLIERETPVNLRIVAEVVAQKIAKGEISL